MKRTIKVFLGETERQIGTLFFAAEGNRETCAFEYHAIWLAAPDRFRIDPTLPLTAGRQFHSKAKDGSAFHSAIADTEPDGWGRRVIQRDHAKQRETARRSKEPFDARPLNSLDFLLAVDDGSRVGALRFQDEKGVFCRKAEIKRRTTPPTVELSRLLAASRAVETNSETEADLKYMRGRATSLGGIRPKCSVVEEDRTLWIGKFPSVSDERQVTKGEVLALQLATRAGISAAETKLIDSDGTTIALIRRFDRKGGKRIMYVSAATLLGVPNNDESDHAYTEIVDVLRVNGADPQRDIEELWRRIAFSILINNVDDHLHNHGFLHVDKDRWRLSPAFDINPFPDKARELKTWISEEAGADATIEALMSIAPYCRIEMPRAREILGEVESAVASWRDHGRSLGMTDDQLDQFAEAFEHSERENAQRMVRQMTPVPEPAPSVRAP